MLCNLRNTAKKLARLSQSFSIGNKISVRLLKKSIQLKNHKKNAEHLRTLNTHLRIKNKKLKSRLEKMKTNSHIMNPSASKTDDIPNGNKIDSNNQVEIEQIKKKYPNLPEAQIERIEVERAVARHLMSMNSGCFQVSRLMKTIEDIYSINSTDRLMLLNEIKNWIERDPLCKVVKNVDNINHYAFI